MKAFGRLWSSRSTSPVSVENCCLCLHSVRNGRAIKDASPHFQLALMHAWGQSWSNLPRTVLMFITLFMIHTELSAETFSCCRFAELWFPPPPAVALAGPNQIILRTRFPTQAALLQRSHFPTLLHWAESFQPVNSGGYLETVAPW